MRFFITGLPRSRTAWFAIATGAAHEPISRMGWPAFRPEWDNDRGVSDSGAGMVIEQIFDAYAPRTLIIERLIPEVIASFTAFVRPMQMSQEQYLRLGQSLTLLQAKLDEAKGPLVRRVKYEALADRETLDICFDHLGIQPRSDLDQLMRMNIQSVLAWNLQQLQRAA